MTPALVVAPLHAIGPATGVLARRAVVPALLGVPALPAVLVGSDKTVGLAFWSLVLAALAGLELAAHRSHRPGRPPSFGQLVARYLAHPAWRTAGVVVWLYAGWHLFSH